MPAPAAESGIRIKSYFSASVEEAVQRARRELGSEAILLNSRKAGRGGEGDYEVVFALAPEVAPIPWAAASKPAAAPPTAAALSAPADPLARQVAALERQIEMLERGLAFLGRSTPAWLAGRRELAEAYLELIDDEFHPGFAEELVRAAMEAGALERGALRETIAAEAVRRVALAPGLGAPGAPLRAAAFVGPAGSGKTSALIKLAIQGGVRQGRAVRLFSLDTRRVGAAGEIEAYAAILGAECCVFRTAAELADALGEAPRGELVLIDTPGFAPADTDAPAALARFFAAHPEIDLHLVVSASLKPADLARTLDRCEPFRTAKLLFTRLDETATYGAAVSEAVRRGKALSFLSTGPGIPQDLLPAAPKPLAKLLLSSWQPRRSA